MVVMKYLLKYLDYILIVAIFSYDSLSTEQADVMDLDSFGEGSDPIWLDEVNCDGPEQNIADCPHDPWGDHNCKHREDLAVDCGPEPFTGQYNI